MEDGKEAGGAAPAAGEEGKVAEGGAPAKVVAKEKGGDSDLKAKVSHYETVMEDLKPKIAHFEKINQRYKEDPVFREHFHKIWKGEVAAGNVKEEAGEADPIDEVRSMLSQMKEEQSEYKKEMDALRGVIAGDKESGVRGKIDGAYKDKYSELAAAVGYEEGSDAYDILFDSVINEGKRLAVKYGLTREDGSPDPLRKYNDAFIEEAFNNAFEKQKRAGFDESWKKRQEAAKIQKRVDTPDKYAKFLDPKNLKTRTDRSKALEKMFKSTFGHLSFENIRKT